MTFASSDRIRHLTDLCGLAGALLFFTGDIPRPARAIFVGGSDNLSIALFFFVSLITTWNAPTVTSASR